VSHVVSLWLKPPTNSQQCGKVDSPEMLAGKPVKARDFTVSRRQMQYGIENPANTRAK
jgi:hypothetical protein